MTDVYASFRQQSAEKLLRLCSAGKYPDAAYECCLPTLSPDYLKAVLHNPLTSGGPISWIEPVQITPHSPPRTAAPICLRLCAVFLRFGFGRGQAVFDVGFAPDNRVCEVVPDEYGYHLVAVPKQPGSVWAMEQLPEPPVTVKARVECHLTANSRQVLFYPVPPVVENCQNSVSIKTYPEGATVISNASNLDKIHILFADSAITPVVVAEIQFNYARRYLTVKTPQPGQRVQPIRLHASLVKAYTSSDPFHCNFQENAFQIWLQAHNLKQFAGEDVVSFAHRVMLFLSANFIYNPITALSKSGGALVMISQRELDAAGHAVLFVSILRASAIPARILVGRWVPPDTPPPAFHVRAEFFADGVGWVPVETTEKSEVLYFGSDAKIPFMTASFADSQQFKIPTSIPQSLGQNMQSMITLSWREPQFSYIAGNLTQLSANIEQWNCVISETVNTPGQSKNAPGNSAQHSSSTLVRYARGHTSGAPEVGAYTNKSHPTQTNSLMTSSTSAPPPLPSTNRAPPPIPPRHTTAVGVSYPLHTQAPPMYAVTPVATGPPPPLPPHAPVLSFAPPPMPVPLQQAHPPLTTSSSASYAPTFANYPPNYTPNEHGGVSNSAAPALPPSRPSSNSLGNSNYNNDNNYGNGYNNNNQLPIGYNNNNNPPGNSNSVPPGWPPSMQPPSNNYDNSHMNSNLANNNNNKNNDNHFLQQQQPPSNGNMPPQQQFQPPPSSSQSPYNVGPPGSSSGPQMILPKAAGAKQPLQPQQPKQSQQQVNNPSSLNNSRGPSKSTGVAGPKNPNSKVAAAAKKWSNVPAVTGAPPKVNSNAPSDSSGSTHVQSLSGSLAKLPIHVGPGGPPRSPRKLPFARATFDHVPQDDQELPLTRGDIIRIVEETDDGWWKGERLGKAGLVPAPYLEKVQPGTRIAKASFQFSAPEPTDLKMDLNEYAVIIDSTGDWWEAEARGQKGSIPSNYVCEIFA